MYSVLLSSVIGSEALCISDLLQVMGASEVTEGAEEQEGENEETDFMGGLFAE